MRSASELRAIAFDVGLEKAAAARVAIDDVLDHVMGDARDMSGNQSLAPDTELEDALPKGMELEALIANAEHNFGVHLDDAKLAELFAKGTLRTLAVEISRLLLRGHSKVANDIQARQKTHQRYLANRGRLLARSKTYRMIHMHTIRRKQRAYRKKVKRRIIRPKKRVGNAGSGFSFVMR